METHYADQWTATTSAFYHYNTGYAFESGYYGWVGVDGEIDAPDHVPNLQSPDFCAHSSGQLGFNLGDGSLIQIGWYTGCFIRNENPVICRYTTLGGFVERYNAGTNQYFANDINYIAPSSSIIFQIELDKSNPQNVCWRSYWYYDQATTYDLCAPIPQSGEAFAGAEVHTHDPGAIVEMPLTYYGNSNPNTNNGLRIKGANGYEVWSNNLSSYTTAAYDERTGAPGCDYTCTLRYWYSETYLNYRIDTYCNAGCQ